MTHNYQFQSVTRVLATAKSSVEMRFSQFGNGRTSQFMFPRYLVEYHNVKIVKSNFKREKCNEKYIKAISFKRQKKDINKDSEIDIEDIMSVTSICLLRICICKP